MINKLLAYLLIPHELLHLAAYRIMDKQCVYEWGKPYIKLMEPVTRRERLIGLLSPFVGCSILSIILIIPFNIGTYYYIYRQASISVLFISLLFGLLTIIAIYNVLASIGDLQKAHQLLNNKPLDVTTLHQFLLQVQTPTPSRRRVTWLIILFCLILLLS